MSQIHRVVANLSESGGVWHNPIALQRLLQKLDGPVSIWEAMTDRPVVLGDSKGKGMSPPEGEEAGHPSKFRFKPSIVVM